MGSSDGDGPWCPSCGVPAEGERFCPVCGMDLYADGRIRSIHGQAEDVLRVYREVVRSSVVCPCGTELAPAEAGNRFSHGSAGTVVQIGSVYGDISVHGGDPPRPGEAETDPGAEAGPADDPPGETAR